MYKNNNPYLLSTWLACGVCFVGGSRCSSCLLLLQFHKKILQSTNLVSTFASYHETLDAELEKDKYNMCMYLFFLCIIITINQQYTYTASSTPPLSSNTHKHAQAHQGEEKEQTKTKGTRKEQKKLDCLFECVCVCFFLGGWGGEIRFHVLQQ